MELSNIEPQIIWKNFSKLNAVPRPSKKEEKVIAFIKEFGENLGLETTVDEVGNVIIKKPATPGMENRKSIVMQSHLDMVCQKNNDVNFDFETQGIQMEVDGDWVKAKGTTLGADNGLGVATIMSILESSDIPHPDLEALFTIDEETGMTGALGLKPGQLTGQILLNLDTEEDDEIDIGCAGGIDVTVSQNYSTEASNGQIVRIEIKSHDGVMVPLSIIYPKNMKMDGSNPAYITGYGGYGFSYEPRFSTRLSVLLEQGVVIAIAHVRGGGEKGEKWHEEGMKATKPNTWKDFIACSEYLVNQKYTSPSKLIGNGVSAGGILIGRAITERPDLFAVAIAEVGMTNTLRSETTANGPNQIPEIGSIKNEEDTKHLIEMDAQSKVKKGGKYPAVIICDFSSEIIVNNWVFRSFRIIILC
jgi:hypothetical protein